MNVTVRLDVTDIKAALKYYLENIVIPMPANVNLAAIVNTPGDCSYTIILNEENQQRTRATPASNASGATQHSPVKNPKENMPGLLQHFLSDLQSDAEVESLWLYFDSQPNLAGTLIDFLAEKHPMTFARNGTP